MTNHNSARMKNLQVINSSCSQTFFVCRYESNENMTITCSTKVCSFGKQVVEKVETEYPRFENGRFVYRIHRSPMCEYMINFIHKLKHLPEKYMMNSVLENFTILQVLSGCSKWFQIFLEWVSLFFIICFIIGYRLWQTERLKKPCFVLLMYLKYLPLITEHSITFTNFHVPPFNQMGPAFSLANIL